MGRYRKAIRKAHNGYDKQARKHLPELKKPKSPKKALKNLLEEAEAIGRDSVLEWLKLQGVDGQRFAEAYEEKSNQALFGDNNGNEKSHRSLSQYGRDRV